MSPSSKMRVAVHSATPTGVDAISCHAPWRLPGSWPRVHHDATYADPSNVTTSPLRYTESAVHVPGDAAVLSSPTMMPRPFVAM